MSKFTDVEEERLAVAELRMQRLLATIKSKLRKGRDLQRLKLIEQAANSLLATRLT